MYRIQRASHSAFVPIRGLRYHVRSWSDGEADPALPPLVLVHGWMDVAASWQFMVDAFSSGFMRGRRILAPDWRGFGHTAPPPGTDHFVFADYLGDLDALLDTLVGAQPVDLIGHSMGGNVAMIYAGVRPARIRRLVNLEGFGLPATRPEQAGARYAQWLDELRALHAGDLRLKDYDSLDAVARRLMKTNPRLSPDKASWLAQHWAEPDAAGRWRILGDAAHKITHPMLYRVEEVLAIYRAITAPVLAVEADGDSLSQWWKGRYSLAEYHERLRAVPDCRVAVVADAGHMLHHDQPEELARLIESFLA
ncbi:alpha/beta hydrolase [Tibeticola sp.]|uniref:alpha/beta fold hydrolase n=1 Tax=Tibeticola sp. TaxID=2005368 RepID=UPI0025887C14|nr:alpha/beta hydrolase [Tibeticola sp.]MCI4439806.1 alpha/beta hydrolase [Tibeticola sp.]